VARGYSAGPRSRCPSAATRPVSGSRCWWAPLSALLAVAVMLTALADYAYYPVLGGVLAGPALAVAAWRSSRWRRGRSCWASRARVTREHDRPRRRLRFTYGAGVGRRDGVDLEVAAGEVLVLEGPSGGGKSTLLRACRVRCALSRGRFEGGWTVDGMDTMRTAPARVARTAGWCSRTRGAGRAGGRRPRCRLRARERRPSARPIPGACRGAGCGGCGPPVAATHRRPVGRRAPAGGGGGRAGVPSAMLLLDEPPRNWTMRRRGAHRGGAGARRRGHGVVIAEHRGERCAPWPTGCCACSTAGGRGRSRTPRRIARCPGARGGAPRARGHRCGYRAGRSSPTRAATVRGTVTALRGPNGSGKTLIARIIAGCTGRGRCVLLAVSMSPRVPRRRFPASPW